MKNSSCAWKNLIFLLQSLIKLGTIIINFKAQNLADGTYELVPESESEQREAQANLTEAAKTRTKVRKSPRLTLLSKTSPGACSIYFKIYATYYYSYPLAHLSLQELLGTLAA